MRKYSFATVVTNKDGLPVATQLPFVVIENQGKLLLKSHFAKANKQSGYIEGNTSLIIFSEPHAYISPSHYDKQESVPTWDYIAVHAYGKAKIIDDEGDKLSLLEESISFYEQGYMSQWQSLSTDFKTKMIRGIVAFEIEITELQGQQKLSQNKSVEERKRIIEQLENSNIGAEKDLAPFIAGTMTDQ